MSFSGDYWGPKGALVQRVERFNASPKKFADYFVLASVKYSAATRSGAEALIAIKKLRFITAIIWACKCLFLGNGAMRCVNKAVKMNFHNTFDTEQMEIALAVWLRFGWLRVGRKPEALWVLFRASEIVFGTTTTARPHAKAFILSYALYWGKYDRSEKNMERLEELAHEAENEGELAQASRLWRHIADHWTCLSSLFGDEYEGKIEWALKKARDLAIRSSPDQLVKLEA